MSTVLRWYPSCLTPPSQTTILWLDRKGGTVEGYYEDGKWVPRKQPSQSINYTPSMWRLPIVPST